MLTPGEVAHFHETGQVTPATRLDTGLIAGIEAKMEALIAAHPDLDPDYTPNLIEIDQSWLDYALIPEILDAVEQLIGANIIVWGSALFCKKGRGGKPTFWHQDGTYWLMRPLAACSVWIASTHRHPRTAACASFPVRTRSAGCWRTNPRTIPSSSSTRWSRRATCQPPTR